VACNFKYGSENEGLLNVTFLMTLSQGHPKWRYSIDHISLVTFKNIHLLQAFLGNKWVSFQFSWVHTQLIKYSCLLVLIALTVALFDAYCLHKPQCLPTPMAVEGMDFTTVCLYVCFSAQYLKNRCSWGN